MAKIVSHGPLINQPDIYGFNAKVNGARCSFTMSRSDVEAAKKAGRFKDLARDVLERLKSDFREKETQ